MSISAGIEAPIFDIQRFSIHDGPGIRTLVFFKGCNLRCAWCQNPESQSTQPLISFYENRCDKSLDCLSVCESGAINPDGYRIDHDRCTTCMKCVDVCVYEALKLVGDRMTAKQLMSAIEQDSHYYKTSGGGVTFSGGEPTLYPKFMGEILVLCNEANIHTTIETCGSFSFERWQDLLRKLDLIYFDLKIMDAKDHQAHIGFDVEKILRNARLLVEQSYPVEFRFTLVQGYTDDSKNIETIIEFLKGLGVDKLHLQSYHNMGETKIDLIHGDQQKLGLETYPQAGFDKWKSYLLSEGIQIEHA